MQIIIITVGGWGAQNLIQRWIALRRYNHIIFFSQDVKQNLLLIVGLVQNIWYELEKWDHKPRLIIPSCLRASRGGDNEIAEKPKHQVDLWYWL